MGGRYFQSWEIEWIEVGKRVLKGEFDQAGRDRLASVAIGLRSMRDPVSRRAMQRIEKLQAELKAKR
jgi:hypothetical protein